MDEIQNHINEAFKAISSIYVAGDAVEAMAVARSHLRKAYGEIEEMKKGGNHKDE